MYTVHRGIYGILIKDNQLLLVRKARGPYSGLLDLPGGKPEPGESDSEALMREWKEETGIIVCSHHLLTETEVTLDYTESKLCKRLKHIGIIHSIDTYDASTIDYNKNEEDVHGADWYTITELKKEELTPFAALAIELFLQTKNQDSNSPDQPPSSLHASAHEA